MLYNKRQVRKANDKKVLHKVGKQWQVVSLALLMAIGGIGAATHLSAHADTTNNNNRANADSTNTIKERLNSSLQKTSAQGSQANQNVRQTQAASPKSITNQASVLHNRILQNATQNVNTNRQQANSPVQSQGRVNANATQQNSANGNNQAATLRQRINNSTQTKGVETPIQHQVGGQANTDNVETGNTLKRSDIKPTDYPNGQYFDNVPVTVAYVNSDGTVQTASDGQSKRVATKYITLAGNNGNYQGLSSKKTGSDAVYSSDATNTVNNHYSVDTNALNNFKWSINGGTYSFDPTGLVSVDPNNAQSDSVIAQSGKNKGTWAAWDSANNRPLIVMKSTAPSKQIIVNFYNQTGQSLGSHTLTGDYGETINTQSDASDYNPDSTDYDVDNSNIKNNYTFSDTPQNVTIPLKGKNTVKDTNSNSWSGNATKDSNGKWSTGNPGHGQANQHNQVTVHFTLKDHDGQQHTASDTIYLNGQIGSFKDLDPHDFLNQTRNPNYDPRTTVIIPKAAHFGGPDGKELLNNKTNQPMSDTRIDSDYYSNVQRSDYNPMGYWHNNKQVYHGVADPDLVFHKKGDPNNGKKGISDETKTLTTPNGSYNPAVWVHQNPNWNPGDPNTGARYTHINGGKVENNQYNVDEQSQTKTTPNGNLGGYYTPASQVPKPNKSDFQATLKGGHSDEQFFATNSDYNPMSGTVSSKWKSLLAGKSSFPSGYTFKDGNNTAVYVNPFNKKPTKKSNAESMIAGDIPVKKVDEYSSVHLQKQGEPEEDNQYLDGTDGSTPTINPNYNPMVWQNNNSDYNPMVKGGKAAVNNQKYIIDDSTKNGDGSWTVAKNGPKGDIQVGLDVAQRNQDDDVQYTPKSIDNSFQTPNPNYNPVITKYQEGNGQITLDPQSFSLTKVSDGDSQGLLDQYSNPHAKEQDTQFYKNKDYNPGQQVANPNVDTQQFLRSSSPFATNILDNYVVDPGNADDKRFYLKGAQSDGTQQAVTYSVSDGKVGKEIHDIPLTFDQASDYGNSAKITLTYRDQDNNVVGTDTITPDNDAYGSTIDMTNSDSAVNGKDNINGQSDTAEATSAKDYKTAKGMNVPSGYQIVPNQTTKFTVNSDTQNPTVYVVGNDFTTNGHDDPHTFTVRVNEQLYNSDGTKSSSNQKGFNNGIKTITLHPTFAGKIGDSKTLYASMFQPARNYSNNHLTKSEQSDLGISDDEYSNPTGTPNYQMKFAPNNITDTKGNVAGSNGAFGSTDGSVDFNFNIYPRQATYTTNHIYYISASDMNAFSHNVDDIDHDPNKANFITEKSDRGIPGKSTFSDGAYRENVPLGYQFNRVLGTTTNGKWNSNIQAKTDSAGTYYPLAGNTNVPGLTGYANGDQDEFIEVTPNAKPINFQYVDQNGKVLKNYTDSATMSQYIKNDGTHGYNSKWGQQVPTEDIEKNVPDHAYVLGVPDGYSVDPHDVPDQIPTFGRYVQNIKVQVVGNQVNPKQDSRDVAMVHVHEEDPEGNVVTKTYSDPDYVDGRIGDSFNINASDYIPNGYGLDTNKGKDQTVKGTIQQTGVNPNTADFYYKPIADHNVQDLKPVNVVFKDGSSQVSYQLLNPNAGDYSGESVDVRGLSGYTVPSGYKLVPNQNFNAVMSTSKDPTVNLQVFDPQTSDAGIIRITQKRYHNFDTSDSGNILHHTKSDDTTTSDVAVHGKKGSSEYVNASDHELDGYADSGQLYINKQHPQSPVNFTDTRQEVKFGSDGQVYMVSDTSDVYTKDGVNNITWNYLAQSSKGNGNTPVNPNQPGPVGPKTNKAQPIYVQYYLGAGTSHPLTTAGANGNSDIRVDGYMNQNYSDISQANSDTRKIFTDSVPVESITGNKNDADKGNYNGFHLTGIQNLDYSIANQEQQVDLHVEPNKQGDQQENVTLQLQSPNGSDMGSTISTHPITVSDGQVVTIQASDYLHGNPDFITEGFNNGQNYQKDYTIKNDNGHLKAYNTSNGSDKNSAVNPVTFDYRAKSSNSDTNVRPLIINFYNKDGELISGPQTMSVYKSNSSVNNKLYSGEKVNLFKVSNGQTTLNSDVTDITMPSGYSTFVGGQNGIYTIGNHDQYANLVVQGDKESAKHFPIHTVEFVQGQAHNGNSSDAGPFNYGSDFHVKASDYKPNTGKDSVVDGTPTSDEVSINLVKGNPVFNPTSDTFYYDQRPTGKNDGPLMVKYVDQSGDVVKTAPATPLSGYNQNGRTISDVATDTKDGLAAPGNYTVNPNQYLAYQFQQGNGKSDQTLHGDTKVDQNGFGIMTIGVTGKKAPSHEFTVKQTLIDRNGNEKVQYQRPYLSDSYGDTITIDASDYSVPGYHVSSSDTPAKVHVNNDGSLSPDQASFVYDQNQTNQAGNITLTYINQNGQEVSPTGYIGTKSDVPYTMNGTGMFGQKIDVTNGNKVVPGVDGQATGENVPNGYHVDSGQQTKYVFGYNSQNVVVMVHGNPVNPSDDNVSRDQLTIKLEKQDANGKAQPSDTIRRYIDNQQIKNSGDNQGLSIGDTISLTPSQFTPQGSDGMPYVPTNPNAQTVTIGPNDQIISPSNKTMTFSYKQVKNASAPLNLTYLNQSGKQVGYTDPIIGSKGETVNVLDPSQGGEAVPDGYSLDPHQKTSYQLSGNGHSIYLHVTGKQIASPKMTITIVTKNADGTTSVSDDTKNLSDLVVDHHMKDGNVYSISASDYNPNNKVYQEDFSKDSTKTVTVGATSFDKSGNPTDSYASPNQVVFYYDTKSSDQDAAPITLRYINQNGQQEGTTDYIHGKLGKTVNLSDVAEGGESVPNGYHIDTNFNPNPSVTNVPFTNSPQIWNVPVVGNKAGDNVFTLHQIIEDSDGNPIAGKAKNIKISLKNAKIGDTITFNPYNFSSSSDKDITGISDGNGNSFSDGNGTFIYSAPTLDNGKTKTHAVNSDADFSVTVQSDGTLSPVNTTDYRYEVSHSPSPIETIKIHYVTPAASGSNGNSGLKGYDELDSESDKGQQGDAFNLRPYRNDIPEEVNGNYTSTGEVFSSDGNKISDNALTQLGVDDGNDVKFIDNNANVYVKVQPNGNKGSQPVWIG